MNDSLPQLPEYDPHPNLWARIEADLNADEQLSRALAALPNYEPKADIWSIIEKNLNPTEPAKVRSLWAKAEIYPFWTGMAVAAVLILVGVWLFLRPETTEKVRMEYAVEQTDTLPNKVAIDTQSSADQRAEEFIARQCAEQELICQRPEIHELRNQLTSLTNEQRRLDGERQIFGNDPALVRAQVKIENQRAEVTKELITLLRS